MTEIKPIGKLGYINRKVDISKVSGIGRIAEFVEYENRVIVQWICDDVKSTVTYDNIDQVKKINCHGGNSEIIYYEQKKTDDELKIKEKLNEIKKVFVLTISCDRDDYQRLRGKIDETIDEKEIDCIICETMNPLEKKDILYLFNNIEDYDFCNKHLITCDLKWNIKNHMRRLNIFKKEYSEKTGIPRGSISDSKPDNDSDNDSN